MLSRTADHLYWMARYTERAENLARMLEVNYRMSLLPQGSEIVEQGWIATLTIIGLMDAFKQRYGAVTPANAIAFLVFDRDNPMSIYSCVRAARENARAVRGTLTSEIWESINATWLEMRVAGMRPSSEAEVGNFFEWVKYRSHLTRGVVQGTMLRDEAWHFTWLGTYLERSDSTARILDVKYHLLLPRGEKAGGAADYYQWGALLNSVSAFEIYRRVYRDLITPRRVAELLVLRADMPRSLHRCVSQVYTHLTAVRNSQSAETERRAGELHASLLFGRIEHIFELGLHEYLVQFMGRTRDLGERVSRDFLVSSAD
ncbi:putative alpha-E superfamily protein [Povalibacter uvarum]|uniref:Putative alpha-E superfamily protein n=1 Tax=Povalibacter uvarum TaxID=732238 RepID=A0A841HQM1_9GAMM|nr:alpha-E domain-containing protein [Povalibacter uvarum]MBB6094530.1 putative alpha-E superfamily protein [Povalibacter uvarum]